MQLNPAEISDLIKAKIDNLSVAQEIRTRGTVYQERGKDSVANLFNIRVINKTTRNIPVTLRLEEEAGPNGTIQLVGASEIHLKDEDKANGTFFVILHRKFLTERKIKLQIGLYEGDKKITTLSTNFASPVGTFD